MAIARLGLAFLGTAVFSGWGIQGVLTDGSLMVNDGSGVRGDRVWVSVGTGGRCPWGQGASCTGVSVGTGFMVY